MFWTVEDHVSCCLRSSLYCRNCRFQSSTVTYFVISFNVSSSCRQHCALSTSLFVVYVCGKLFCRVNDSGLMLLLYCLFAWLCFYLRPPKCLPLFPPDELFRLLLPLLLNERVGVLLLPLKLLVDLCGLKVLLGVLIWRLTPCLLFPLKFMLPLPFGLDLAVVRVLLSRLFLLKLFCPFRLLPLMFPFTF